ncbi:MAG: hypothetical protein ISP41_14100 [Alphaproteobacteria bacterium]|nr:hypothetical protein [Alphaproteobacteria bacterium]
MFDPGQVVYVVSDQAKGYKQRNKYHLCVCGVRGKYLFINRKSWVGSFPLRKADLPAMPEDESHIACNSVIPVSDNYMKRNNARLVGSLSADFIARLIDHINDCEVLTDEQKEEAVDGLTGAIRP